MSVHRRAVTWWLATAIFAAVALGVALGGNPDGARNMIVVPAVWALVLVGFHAGVSAANGAQEKARADA